MRLLPHELVDGCNRPLHLRWSSDKERASAAAKRKTFEQSLCIYIYLCRRMRAMLQSL